MWSNKPTKLKQESSRKGFKESIDLWKPLHSVNCSYDNLHTVPAGCVKPIWMVKESFRCRSNIQKWAYHHTSFGFAIWKSLVFWALTTGIYVIQFLFFKNFVLQLCILLKSAYWLYNSVTRLLWKNPIQL